MGQLFFSGTGVPLSKPEDVIPFLGRKTHWKEGRSAFEVAYTWFEAQDIPKSIRSVLETDPTFQNATLEKAFFEKQTELDRYRGPSQTDVLAILRIASGIALLGIEAKVDESFGQLVKDWEDGSESKKQRLAGLVKRLELDDNAVGQLRYQLLHRTVATLIEAERHGASEAAMIVQSFCPRHTGFSDFQLFAAKVTRFWGDDDYEFWVQVPSASVPKLAFELLREKFSGQLDAVDAFRAWCRTHDVQHEFDSWI